MATEYGVWNAEGCILGSMWNRDEADQAAAAEREAGDEDARADAFCEDHRDTEQPATGCEDCASELADDGSDTPPQYELHTYARGKYAVYDSETENDIAIVTRKTQARALVDGLNEGDLVVEQGLIVDAPVKAGAR